jgi:stress response protein YsnF
VLKEELHIRRATRNEDVEVPVEIRKHRVEIERVPAADERDAGK